MTADFSPRTVGQALDDAAKSTSSGYRFLDEKSEAEPFFSYAGVERATARMGGALQALGLQKGDRVALILPDNTDFVLTFLGAIRAGIVPVPIYPPTGIGKLEGYLENTLHIVQQSGAKVLLTTNEVKLVLGTIQARVGSLSKVVAIESIRSSREELKPAKVGLDDVCFLQFTSGSTSRPKGVVLTHGNLAANVRAIMPIGLGIREGADAGISWLPLYHDMGLIGFVIAPLYHRISVTFLPPLLFLKRPARWLQTISKFRGTVSFGPNFAYALCVKRIRAAEIEGLDLSHWRVAGCGAEPIRAENLKAFADKFESIGFSEKAFTCCYGMAENTLAISFSSVGNGVKVDNVLADSLWSEHLARPVEPESEGGASILNWGPPFPDHAVGVFALDDESSQNPLPERHVGELRLRGPSVMSGYFEEPELTAQTFAGGWLKTGDLGYLADGNVHICGRSKEVIIVNGRNYYPQDLEWEAGKVNGVRKGNVVAFGTMKVGGDRERVILTFETTVADGPERQALKAEVRRVLQQAVGLTIDDVVPLSPGVLPKTSSGKLQRTKTRSLYESGELVEREAPRAQDPIDLVKQVAKSQLGYFRHALLGGTGQSGDKSE